MIVLAVAQLVSPLVKYPRCAAAIAPMTSQTNSRTVPILRVLPVLVLLLVHIHPNYPGGTPAMPGRTPSVPPSRCSQGRRSSRAPGGSGSAPCDRTVLTSW